ncbi:pyruvoyl-dependent arginine decarboxylase [Patescibacteria group bacterium]
MIPSKIFFTKGVGVAREKLNSFELALRDAGIAQYNLVSVSSILPPGCKKISKQKGVTLLSPGEIVFCVMARNETDEPNRLAGAAIGAALPAREKKHGYLSEHHCFGETEDKAGGYAEDLAASMLASTLGLKFNPDDAWDTRKQAFRLSGKIIYTSNVTQTARGNKDGLWTSVVAAAIFIP